MSSPLVTATGGAPKRRHIAFCPFPFFGHPVTFLHLGRKIAASNPDIQITLLGAHTYGMYLYVYLAPEEWDKIVVLPIEDGLEDSWNVTPDAMERFVEVAGKSLREGLAWAEEYAGVKISCLVADPLLSHVCREIAEEMGVKWVAMWCWSSAALAAHMLPRELTTKIGVEGIDEGYRDEVVAGGNSSIMAGLLKRMRLNLPKAAAVAINSFDHLEPAVTETLNAAFGNKFFNSGLYLLTLPFPGPRFGQDHPVFSWLDTHQTGTDSVVYVSYGINTIMGAGSEKLLSPEDYVALAEGLEAAGVTFVWCTFDCHMRKYLPEGFWERTTKSGQGFFTPWSRDMLMTVLNHPAIGAHFTDCVWNSVMESIATGVPMICYTSGHVDEIFNKRLVEKWGIGVGVEGEKLTKSAVARVLKKVMLGEEGRRMRENIRVTKRQAEEAAAAPGGSSVQNLNKFISIITC